MRRLERLRMKEHIGAWRAARGERPGERAEGRMRNGMDDAIDRRPVRRVLLFLPFGGGRARLRGDLDRQLSLVFGTTSFAVSTVLGFVHGGLALGSWWFGRIADRTERPLRLYAMLELGIGIYCLLVPSCSRPPRRSTS